MALGSLYKNFIAARISACFSRYKSKLLNSSSLKWILIGFHVHGIIMFFALIRSLCATYILAGKIWPLFVRIEPGVQLRLIKNSTSRITLKGAITLTPWGGLNGVVTIKLGSNSSLDILGNYTLGPNVHIIIADNGTLSISGASPTGSSGITCETRIMARNYISIGQDSVISWGCFVTDSDWHSVSEVNDVLPVTIGSNTWIGHNVSVLKGAAIPDHSIVASRSLVNKPFADPYSLLAGTPARIVKCNVFWAL